MMEERAHPNDLTVAPEIASAFGIAQALWPSAVEPGSRGVQYAWGHALKPYSHAELCHAFEKLARDRPKFPPLADVLDACREQRQRARRDQAEREAASRPKIVPSRPVGNPLRDGLRRWHDEKVEALRERAQDEGWDEERLRAGETAINARGYDLFGSVRGLFHTTSKSKTDVPSHPQSEPV